MATDVLHPQDQQPSVTALVSGIINDAQTLIQQQVALVREEILADLRRTRQATAWLAAGVAVATLSLIPLTFMFRDLLHEELGWDQWVSDGVVGAVLALVGGGLIFLGVQRFKYFNPLPDQSAEALKENLQWIKNPTSPTPK
jgi:hypothetical protein